MASVKPAGCPGADLDGRCGSSGAPILHEGNRRSCWHAAATHAMRAAATRAARATAPLLP